MASVSIQNSYFTIYLQSNIQPSLCASVLGALSSGDTEYQEGLVAECVRISLWGLGLGINSLLRPKRVESGRKYVLVGLINYHLSS